MEERFERKAETGGEQGHNKSDKSSWRERIAEKIKRKQSKEGTSDDGAEKSVGIFEFIREIFKSEEEKKTEAKPEKSHNFIEKAFTERNTEKRSHIEDDEVVESQESSSQVLEQLDEQTRTEYLMVVAQRFKDAGNRLLQFIRPNESRQTALESARGGSPEQTESLIHQVEAMYADNQSERDTQSGEASLPTEEAPPFDFAVQRKQEAAPRVTKVTKLPSASPKKSKAQPAGGSQKLARASEWGVVDDFDYPTPSRIEMHEAGASVNRSSGVTTFTYRPRFRDILFAGAVGRATARPELKPEHPPRFKYDPRVKLMQPSEQKPDLSNRGIPKPDRPIENKPLEEATPEQEVQEETLEEKIAAFKAAHTRVQEQTAAAEKVAAEHRSIQREIEERIAEAKKRESAVDDRENLQKQIEELTMSARQAAETAETEENEIMATVREALQAVFDQPQQQIPDDLKADPKAAAERLAKAEKARTAEEIKELSFEELKPAPQTDKPKSKQQAKQQDEQKPQPKEPEEDPQDFMPQDNVYVRSVPKKISPMPSKEEAHAKTQPYDIDAQLSKLEEEAEALGKRTRLPAVHLPKELRGRELKPPSHVPEQLKPERVHARTAESAPGQPYGEAQSVHEILANRTKIPQPSNSIRQQIDKQYDIETRRGARSWVATAVIIGLALIGLLFISAL